MQSKRYHHLAENEKNSFVNQYDKNNIFLHISNRKQFKKSRLHFLKLFIMRCLCLFLIKRFGHAGRILFCYKYTSNVLASILKLFQSIAYLFGQNISLPLAPLQIHPLYLFLDKKCFLIKTKEQRFYFFKNNKRILLLIL